MLGSFHKITLLLSQPWNGKLVFQLKLPICPVFKKCSDSVKYIIFTTTGSRDDMNAVFLGQCFFHHGINFFNERFRVTFGLDFQDFFLQLPNSPVLTGTVSLAQKQC